MKTRMNFKDEFYQKLKLLVLPIAIQNFMLALVSATDAIMLGWIDQTSLSAVSLAGQVQFVLSLFISGIAAGAGIMAAQYWGKRDAASIEKVIPIALRTNLLFSGLFTILAGFCPEMLMRIFTNDAALVASGSQYLRAVALSYVLCGISQVYLILLKNTGHAAVSSRISSTAVVLNIILNAILIYGLCGAPALGIRGAAYATVAARVVELIWAYLETKKPERVRILWNRLFSSAGKILSEDFWRYTLPVLAASLVWGIAYVLYSVIMGHMGSDATAANSIASIVRTIIASLCWGIAAGVSIIIGQTLGQNKLEEAKKMGGKFVRLSIWIGAASGLVILLLIPLVLRVITLTPQAMYYLKFMLCMAAYYIIGNSLNSTIISGIFPAGGDTKFGMICDVVTLWCFVVPLGMLAAFVWHAPVLLVAFILTLDEFVKIPAVYIHYVKYKWVKNITR